MALSLTTFTNGATIDATGAASPLARITAVRDYVNFGIGTAEVDTDFVGHKLIYKPDFYGAPTPNTRLESSHVHYNYVEMDRQRRLSFHADKVVFDPNDESTGWMWVPGMCRTIYVPTDNAGQSEESVCRAHVRARCYAYESGSQKDILVAAPPDPGIIDTDAALVFNMAIYVDDDRIAGTARFGYLDGSGDANGPYQFLRKEFNWSGQLPTKLTAGIHTIGVKIRIGPMSLDNGDNLRHKHVWVDGRNFVLDLWLR